MTTTGPLITELWRAGTAPTLNGLYRADGSARAADVGGPDLPRFELGAPIDLEVLLAADPENDVVDVDIAAEAELPDGSGSVCCGYGDLGADGFFARLDGERNLRWIVMLLNSNPFVRVSVEGTVVTFVNNLDNSVTVDLTDPDFA
ncbi:hypothetical protein [Kitasatospora purpeofusca]|uniref:hypothetical protein n=1 Tax=Kitasatospora purpeofusca TaxID=67352 RepID=UPI003810B219